jgi:hypothetical protein
VRAVTAVTAVAGENRRRQASESGALQHTHWCTVGLYGAQKGMESDGGLQATSPESLLPW